MNMSHAHRVLTLTTDISYLEYIQISLAIITAPEPMVLDMPNPLGVILSVSSSADLPLNSKHGSLVDKHDTGITSQYQHQGLADILGL